MKIKGGLISILIVGRAKHGLLESVRLIFRDTFTSQQTFSKTTMKISQGSQEF